MFLDKAIQLIVDTYFLQVETGERFSIELQSGPGLGKSAGVDQAAEKIAARLKQQVTVKPFFLTTVEPPDVRGFGLPSKDKDGSAIMEFTKAPWMPRLEDAKHGLIFLDEFGQASPDVAKPAAELLHSGRVGSSQLPKEYMVVAASNREKDRSGVQRRLAFLQNRIMQIQIQPNVDTWVNWAEQKALNPFAIAFAKFKPGTIFADEIPDKPGPFCTPRTFVKVSHLIGRLPMDMFTEASAGYIGEGAAAEFVAFLRVAEELPKWEEIIAHPDKVKVPERLDATYAATQMVAHRVEAATARPAFTFLKRLGKEFQVSGLRAVLSRCPTMVSTPDFSAWLRENKDLIMAANLLSNK